MFEAVPPGQKIPSTLLVLKPKILLIEVMTSRSMIEKQGAAVYMWQLVLVSAVNSSEIHPIGSVPVKCYLKNLGCEVLTLYFRT